MPPRKPKPVIICDSREKKPWDYSRDPAFAAQEVAALKSGDYSIKGLEDVITVERKRDANELIGNFTTDKDRLYREIDRLKEYKFAAIVIEQSLTQILNHENYYIAKRFKNKKAPVAIVIQNLINIMVEHGIMVIFAGKKAKGITKGLLLAAHKLHGSDSTE